MSEKRKWVAVVLGGGGSLAEFQVGALQVIADNYQSIDMFVGIGAGSLNSAVLAQHDNLQEGYKILRDTWDSFRQTSDVFGGGDRHASVYGNRTLRGIIDRLISWDNLKAKRNWAIELTSLNDGQLYTVTNNEALLAADVNPNRLVSFSLNAGSNNYIGSHLTEILLAGGATPVFLPPVSILGHQFVEGGLKDCTPLELAVKAFELVKDNFSGAEFIVIDNCAREASVINNGKVDNILEVLIRTMKIMTVEIAQNDIAQGEKKMKEIGLNNPPIIIQPNADSPMNPMNFNDRKGRIAFRNLGISIAQSKIPPSPERKSFFSGSGLLQDRSTNAVLEKSMVDELMRKWNEAPENTDYSDKFVRLILESGKEDEHFWNNYFSLDTRSNAGNPVEPENLFQLIALMEDHFSSGNGRIKAMGAGYAFDKVIDCGQGGIQVSMAGLNNIYMPDKSLLLDPAQANTMVEFEAGATIEQINTYLWDNGKALKNQPGYEKLTFAGVSSCGGHGSGFHIGPLSEAILSMDILSFNADGKVIRRRIERTKGITDRAALTASFPAIELIQDDDLFNACSVAVGTMGIIYTMIVATQSRFYLQEERFLIDWEELKPQLFEKLKSDYIHSVHIWFNPYFVKGTMHCVLSQYTIMKGDGPESGRRGFGVTSPLAPLFGRIVLKITNSLPKLLPALMLSSLKSTVNKKPVVLKCFNALNFGTPNNVAVVAANCGIAIGKTNTAGEANDADIVIMAAEQLFALAKSRSQQGAYINSPIGFRFTAPAAAYLAPQYGRSTCMIEMPLMRGTVKEDETIDAFFQLLEKPDLNGRPHWGQRFNRNVNQANINILYPGFHLFQKAYHSLVPTHSFENDFTKQIGL